MYKKNRLLFFLMLSIFSVYGGERTDFYAPFIPVASNSNVLVVARPSPDAAVLLPIASRSVPVNLTDTSSASTTNFSGQAASLRDQYPREVRREGRFFPADPLEILRTAGASPAVSCASPRILSSRISWWGATLQDLYQQANHDNVEAQSQIYEEYQSRHGPFAREDSIFRVYRECKRRMDLGEPFALIMISWMLRDGYGIAKDVPKAYEILQENADCAAAQFHLAELHLSYEGIERDEEKARYYLNQAFKKGYKKAGLLMQMLTPKVPPLQSWTRSASASYRTLERGFSWFSMNGDLYFAANEGDVTAQYRLYNLLDKRAGPFINKEMAFRECHQRALRGDPIAEILIAKMYTDGFGTIQDKTIALPIYQKWAQCGYAWAQLALGLSYIASDDIPRNYKKGAFWIGEAARQEFAPAKFYLGVLFVNGMGVAKDEHIATQLFRAGAEKGHDLSQLALGFRYENGCGGITQNDDEAVKWYFLAAGQGNEFAHRKLSFMRANGRGVKVRTRG